MLSLAQPTVTTIVESGNDKAALLDADNLVESGENIFRSRSAEHIKSLVKRRKVSREATLNEGLKVRKKPVIFPLTTETPQSRGVNT